MGSGEWGIELFWKCVEIKDSSARFRWYLLGSWGLSRPAKKSKTSKLWYMAPLFGVCKGVVVVLCRGCIVILRLKLRICDLEKELL